MDVSEIENYENYIEVPISELRSLPGLTTQAHKEQKTSILDKISSIILSYFLVQIWKFNPLLRHFLLYHNQICY